jgi:hypothetical protein
MFSRDAEVAAAAATAVVEREFMLYSRHGGSPVQNRL